MTEPKKKRPNGAGTIRERTLRDGSKRYDVQVRLDGRKVTVAGGGGLESHDKAIAVLAAFHTEREAAGLFVPRDVGIMTVRRLGELWLASVAHKGTTDARRWNARVLTADFIDWPVTQVDEDAGARWIDTMARTLIAKGKAAGTYPTRGTLQTVLCTVRSAFRWGKIQKHVGRNPFANVTINESTSHARKGTAMGDGFDYLRADEVTRILESQRLPLRPRVAYTLLAFTGARPKDLYRADWKQVDVASGTIRYWSHKRKRWYTVHMLPVALEIMRTWWIKSGRRASGLLFPGRTGKPHTDGYDFGWADTRGARKWKKRLRSGELRLYKTRVGVTVTPGWRTKIGIQRDVPLYSLRHTCASHLLLGTPLFTGGRRWSPEEVASQLGHADLSTVTTYMVALNIASQGAAEESRALIAAQKPAQPAALSGGPRRKR